MEKVFIVHFKDHNSYIRQVIYVASSERRAIAYCIEYVSENPQFKLKRSEKNKKVWIGDGFNYGLEIESFKID